MSQTVIFSVGIFIFAMTIWGAVMAGGIWFAQIAEAEDERSRPRPAVTESGGDEAGGAPTTSQ